MVKFQRQNLWALERKVEATEWEGNKLEITVIKDKIKWFIWETLSGATGIN